MGETRIAVLMPQSLARSTVIWKTERKRSHRPHICSRSEDQRSRPKEAPEPQPPDPRRAPQRQASLRMRSENEKRRTPRSTP